MGLSRSGKTVEVRGRTMAFPEGDIGDDEVVEVHYPESLIRGLFGMCLLGCLFFAILLAITPHLEALTVGLAYILIGFFGLGAIQIWWDRGNPQARADRRGITGYPIGFHIHRRFVPYGLHVFRRFVPWSEVAASEIETFYDTFGKPFIVRPALKDRDGRVLMALNLLYTRFEDQERLVEYIKAKLPKPKVDPEDW